MCQLKITVTVDLVRSGVGWHLFIIPGLSLWPRLIPPDKVQLTYKHYKVASEQKNWVVYRCVCAVCMWACVYTVFLDMRLWLDNFSIKWLKTIVGFPRSLLTFSSDWVQPNPIWPQKINLKTYSKYFFLICYFFEVVRAWYSAKQNIQVLDCSSPDYLLRLKLSSIFTY